MAEEYRFFNSTTDDIREYNAADLSAFFASLFQTGVISGLEVTAVSGGVSVSAGYAIVNGYWYHLDTEKTLSITSKTSAHTDTVVLRLDLNSTKRCITAEYKSGAALENSDNIVEIALAQVKVAANATTAQSITDKRIVSKVVAEADISVADIVAKLQGIDLSGIGGTGTNLDADKLDGKEGSYYSDYNNLSNKPVLCGTAAPSSSVGSDGYIYIQY